MIDALLSSPLAVPICAGLLALALLFVGIAGHVVGAWDLDGTLVRRDPRPAPPTRTVAPAPLVAELDQADRTPTAVYATAERLDRPALERGEAA